MKTEKLSIINIVLFAVSFFLLEKISLSTEFVFNIYRFIFIGIFKVNKIFPAPEFYLTEIFYASIILFSILNYIFIKNKIYLILNQIFLIFYLILIIYPIVVKGYELCDKVSFLYLSVNVIIIVLMSLINFYLYKISDF